MFTVEQRVSNGSSQPLAVRPIGLVSRALKSHDPTTWTNHVGPISVFGGKVNFKATRSCVLPVSAIGTQKVTTIEGLSATGTHPVQQAWIEEQTPQCGFCQNGMMIKATELLESNPNPTLEQIKAAYTTSGVSPILCRCGTYKAVIESVQHAAAIMAKGR